MPCERIAERKSSARPPCRPLLVGRARQREYAVAECYALVMEQPSFALETAAVAGERTVGADHPMTWDHHADWIGPVGHANGSNGSGTSELRRQSAIAERLARRYRRERVPYRALE